ncbi:diguanylate cyclase domain-containing protein [Paenibacillus qinlingensis]|uniref:diguanylate cyclase domain-containing protein n=1 Tax=Paenibacillus qinlingensis TaxID=1837343 RepID=UPI00286D23AB|nr:diguanylate cyclase [Paenibacillus qinlingensis]
MNHMAYHDALTDLPNCRLFKEHLNKGLEQAERGGHQLAVLFLDLNRFKYINDSLGHAFGEFFTPVMSIQSSERLMMEQELTIKHGSACG